MARWLDDRCIRWPTTPARRRCLVHWRAAEFGLPVVKRRFRNAVLARQIGGLRPRLMLAQNTIICSVNLARFMCASFREPDSNFNWGNRQGKVTPNEQSKVPSLER